jgi:hypothetical protein
MGREHSPFPPMLPLLVTITDALRAQPVRRFARLMLARSICL